MKPEAIAKLIVKHERLWGTSLGADERKGWAEELKPLRLLGQEALTTYQAFCDRRSSSARIPRLADVLAALRKQQRRRPGAASESICGLCGGSGWVGIAAPHSQTEGGLRPGPHGFNPSLPWTETPVYSVAVPCACTTGEHVKQRVRCDQEWLDLRDRWIAVAQEQKRPLGHVVGRYLMACATERFQPERQTREPVLARREKP